MNHPLSIWHRFVVMTEGPQSYCNCCFQLPTPTASSKRNRDAFWEIIKSSTEACCLVDKVKTWRNWVCFNQAEPLGCFCNVYVSSGIRLTLQTKRLTKLQKGESSRLSSKERKADNSGEDELNGNASLLLSPLFQGLDFFHFFHDFSSTFWLKKFWVPCLSPRVCAFLSHHSTDRGLSSCGLWRSAQLRKAPRGFASGGFGKEIS